jgi:hypothetical protein
MAEEGAANPTAQNLPLPDPFHGATGPKQTELWPKWIRRFERYRYASGLVNKPRKEQVCTLLFAMGSCADDILCTLTIDEDKATYDEMKEALNKYFAVRSNLIVERAKFNKRCQMPGEAIEDFIHDLYRLADNCAYGALKNELIRDRIVVGVLEDRLSDSLQGKPNLTLEDASTICRQTESRKDGRDIVRGDSKPVDYVQARSTQHSQRGHSQRPKSHSQPSCKWCGHERHDRNVCPAKDVTCNKCSKRGHYQAVCRSGGTGRATLNEVQDLQDVSIPFLGEIRDDNSVEHWTAEISVNDHPPTLFKLDTGATVSVVSDTVPWLDTEKLSTTKQILRGPGGTNLEVLGMLQASLRYKDRTITEPIYVIQNQPCSLLSRKACVDLTLLKRINEVSEPQESSPDFKAEYPALFTGLGKLKTEYHITLKPDHKPVCLYTPRKIPHPLMPKVKTEIYKMVDQGVISPVTSPTEWCSGIVCVPKPNGSVRICVDLTQLNKSVQREIHPMSSVDDSLAKLGKSKIFTKLDANSGFGSFHWTLNPSCSPHS